MFSYRLPAEWEPQEATWLIWPGYSKAVTYWNGQEEALRQFYDIYIKQLLLTEVVQLIVHDTMEHTLPCHLHSDPRITIHNFASDDIWLRDTSPIFLIPSELDANSSSLPFKAVCGRWGAYGGKYHPCDRDAHLAGMIADQLKCQRVDLPLVLEGGAFDSDGQGTLLLSRRSILCDIRNPGCSADAIEALICEVLGVARLIWIDGCLHGDDTDGHVDQLVRFVSPGRLLVANQPDPHHPDHAMLQGLQQRLSRCRDAHGRSLELIPVDLPPMLRSGTMPLPASYLNFYIANQTIYVPWFAVDTDSHALAILQQCFPDRRVVAIDCRVLIHGGGALHCISRQQPLIRASSLMA